MHLDKTIESFYLNIIDFAGLKVDIDDNITNINEDIGELTVDGKYLALPYMELLRNPKGKRFFHPLHENYSNPETVTFNLYKRRLTLEINLKLQQLMVSLIALACDPKLQSRVKDTELVTVLSNIGELDMSIIESLFKMCKVSREENDVGMIFDIFLKKNGSVGGESYAAIGKINHKLYNEVQRSLEEGPSGEYRVYGTKFRKKDLVAVSSILEAIFPDLKGDNEEFMDGTDNKIFRYLNILLKTAYIMASRIDQLGRSLKELDNETLHADDILLNLEWVKQLPDLYNMAEEIRMIPNQTDMKAEGKEMKLKLDESRAANDTRQQMNQVQTQAPVPQFSPQVVPQQQTQQPQYQTPPPQPQQPPQQRELTPEEIVRARMSGTPVLGGYPQQQMMQQPMYQQQPMMQPTQVPTWVREEAMRQQMQSQQPPQQGYYQQQPMMQQGYPNQQPMMQQGYPNQQPMMQQSAFNQGPQQYFNQPRAGFV